MKIRVLQTLEISLKTIMTVRARYQISAQLESSSLGISAWKYFGLILVVNDNSRFSHRHSVIYIFSVCKLIMLKKDLRNGNNSKNCVTCIFLDPLFILIRYNTEIKWGQDHNRSNDIKLGLSGIANCEVRYWNNFISRNPCTEWN